MNSEAAQHNVSQWDEIEALINRREFKRAEVLLAKISRDDSAEATQLRVNMYRAKLRLLMGRAHEALSLLKPEGAERLQGNAEYAELLADIYFQRYELANVGFADKADLQMAQHLYETILSAWSDYENRGWVHYQLGRVLLISAQPSEAEVHFRQALFEPSHIVTLTSFTYERLAYLHLYEHRRSDRALTFIDKALATYPASEPRGWMVQALILKSKICQYLNMNQALAVANEAHRLATARSARISRALVAESWLNMADLASRLRGREQHVVDCVHKFLQLSRNPLGVDVTWARAHEMLAEAHFALKHYAQALAAYQTMLEFNPYYPWISAIRLRMAECHLHLGQHAEAALRCQEVLADQDFQDNHRARALLAQAQQAI